ncbi:MAG: alpha/beta hydrolase [Prevotella sp.]|nr:alpha/beta hydrolase [Prevotella sp.]
MKRMMMMAVMAATMLSATAQKTGKLQFDKERAQQRTLTMPDGQTVNYKAYERLYYVTNVEDSAYQYMNVYVPEEANQKTPILLRTYVGGYMAAAAAEPQATDATGRALKEGFVVAIPGARGRNSTVDRNGMTIYTGRAPRGLLDLKAAVRYLRLFDKQMEGSADRIITDGTSAGGAMSALLGATGNNPAYDEMLKQMGAADTKDDVYASICFCPIIDLEHADMAYEWLYNCTNNRTRPLSNEQAVISNELAATYPAYLNSLGLKHPETGEPITADNMRGYIKQLLIHSAQLAKDAGADIPDTIGFTFSETPQMGTPPLNGVTTQPNKLRAAAQLFNQSTPGRPFTLRKQQGEYITNLDMETYLNYVVTTQPLKTPPAFDALGVAGAQASGENEVFGDTLGTSVNFTDYSAMRNGGQVSDEVKELVRLMNPMNFVGARKTDVAKHWYIRHGARDRDTAFPVPVAFATKLQNEGKNVNFLLAWNRPHSGDYSLNELFEWMKSLTK